MQAADEKGDHSNEAIDRLALHELRLHLSRRQALSANRQAQWLVDYITILSRILGNAGLGATELAPMADVSRRLLAEDDEEGGDETHMIAYAHASAEIAFLILTGTDEAEAAQRVSRQLLAEGIPMPSQGGDARGWRRLLAFRDRLRHGLAGDEAAEAYRAELARLKATRKP